MSPQTARVQYGQKTNSTNSTQHDAMRLSQWKILGKRGNVADSTERGISNEHFCAMLIIKAAVAVGFPFLSVQKSSESESRIQECAVGTTQISRV